MHVVRRTVWRNDSLLTRKPLRQPLVRHYQPRRLRIKLVQPCFAPVRLTTWQFRIGIRQQNDMTALTQGRIDQELMASMQGRELPDNQAASKSHCAPEACGTCKSRSRS